MAARKPDRKKRTPAKPTWASVKSRQCTCGFLERVVAEPGIPIVFDERTNEYHVVHNAKDRGGHTIIYHCPFCGGAAPRSKRGSLFATITSDEARRLHELASGLRTINDAITRLGKPDEDHDPGMTVHTKGSASEPPKVVSYRLLRYTHLSKVANVELIDQGPERGIRVVLQGKYLGGGKAQG